MASEFKIEKGIPAPPPTRGKYPFDAMSPGDSFLVADMKTSGAMSSAISYRTNRYGEKYRCKAEDGGLRVWRIA